MKSAISTVAKSPANSSDGIDLLRFSTGRRIILGRSFPIGVQVGLLIAFVALAVMAWNVFPPPRLSAKLFAKSNLVTLLIWGLWWPAMILGAVLFGRLWCMVCPLELASTGGERFAERFLLPRRPLPRWIAAGSVMVVLYGVVQMLVAGAQLNRIPAYTSMFLFALLGVALWTAIVFRDRAFCRGFCPVGLLLGTYGRGGMIAVRPGLSAGTATASLNPPACPTLLNPSKLASNASCLVCGHCLKTSAPGAMRLMLRPPFAISDRREPAAPWPVTIFVMLVSGFVISELASEWRAAEHMLVAIPTQVAESFGWPAAAGWCRGVWFLLVVPLLIWSALGAIMRALGATEPLGALWRRIAVPMAVIVAAGHMSKGLAKFVSWAPFLPGALSEPGGIETASSIAARTRETPVAWLPLPAVALIGLGLIAIAVIYGIREDRLANPGELRRWQRAVPFVLIGLLFGAIVSGWTLH